MVASLNLRALRVDEGRANYERSARFWRFHGFRSRSIGKLNCSGGGQLPTGSRVTRGLRWLDLDQSCCPRLVRLAASHSRLRMEFDPVIGRLRTCIGGADNLGPQRTVTLGPFERLDVDLLSHRRGPPARELASMAYDPAIGQLVLFGWIRRQPSTRSPITVGASTATTWDRAFTTGDSRPASLRIHGVLTRQPMRWWQFR
jgi:hypothetical protein